MIINSKFIDPNNNSKRLCKPNIDYGKSADLRLSTRALKGERGPKYLIAIELMLIRI